MRCSPSVPGTVVVRGAATILASSWTREVHVRANGGSWGKRVTRVIAPVLLTSLLTVVPAQSVEARRIDWVRSWGGSLDEFGADVVVAGGDIFVAGTVHDYERQTSTGTLRRYRPDGTLVWERRFPTPGGGYVDGIAASGNRIYVAGTITGPLPGQTARGGRDGYVRAFDLAGTTVWARQLGTLADDTMAAVTADASGPTVAMSTDGTFPGEASAGDDDVVVSHLTLSGAHGWTDQFGTWDYEMAEGIASYGGRIFVAAMTRGSMPGHVSVGDADVVVRAYGANGAVQWTSQFGTGISDRADGGIVAGAAGVFVAGTMPDIARAASGDYDLQITVQRLTLAGARGWSRQFGGTPQDFASSIALGSQGVYVAGKVQGALSGHPAGANTGAALRLYSFAGAERWTRFVTPMQGGIGDVTVDASERIYVSGGTSVALGNHPHGGGWDAFLMRLTDRPAPDTQRPSVGVASPTEGAGIRTTTIIRASAWDDFAIRKVEFRVNGALLATDTMAPFEATWQPPNVSLATRQIVARAYDTSGNWSDSPVRTVYVDRVAPTARPPVPNFVTGVELGLNEAAAGRVSPMTRIAWPAASDAGSGAVGYELLICRASGACDVSYGTTTGLSWTDHLFPDFVFRPAVVAYDRAGNGSAPARGTPFSLHAIEETSSAVSFPAGTWRSEHVDDASGSARRYATASGATARVAIPSGTDEVLLGMARGPDRGRFHVFVDGTRVTSTPIDLYAPARTPLWQVYRIAVAPGRSHRLEIRLTGTKNASSTGTRVDFDVLVRRS
jgi:hypothetical protein